MKSRAIAHRAGPGIFRITEFTNPSGAVVYRVTGWTMEGGRVRENFKTHGEAIARKQELETEAGNVQTAGQTVFTRLTPAEVNDAEAARSILLEAGMAGTSFRSMAEFYVRNYRDPLKRLSVEEATKRFLAEKTAARRRSRHLKSLRIDLDALSNLFGNKPTHELTKEDLLNLIEAPERSARTQNHVRDRYHNFLGWCVKNGHAPENVAARIEKKSVEAAEIARLSNDEVARLMAEAAKFKKGKLVPYLALATFCAIRPDELARLSWEQIDLEEKQVTITASAAKKRGRRIVEMPDNCVAWLKPYAKKKPAFRGKNWRKDFDAVRENAGFGNPAPEDASPEDKKKRAHFKPWPQDVLRHTGISCHYRKHDDEGKTAAWAGNSPDMIHTHYRALVSAKEAEAFFEIRPAVEKQKSGKQKAEISRKTHKAAVPENVVAMPKAA